jgi:hypothetical protein
MGSELFPAVFACFWAFCLRLRLRQVKNCPCNSLRFFCFSFVWLRIVLAIRSSVEIVFRVCLTKNSNPTDKQTKKTTRTEKLFVPNQKNVQKRKPLGKHRPKIRRSENPRKTPTPKWSKFDKIAIKTSFWGGFAVDADFSDAFSGSIEGPKIMKNQ